VRVGQMSVILNGTSGNCVITGGDQRFVIVAFNAVTDVAFVINCVTAGRVLLTATTTGVDLDSNGYGFELTRLGPGGFAGGSLPANGSVLRTGLLPGDYVLNFSDIDPNCSAGANTGPVTVIGGSETQVALHVECAALSKLAFVSVLNGNNGEIFVAKTNGTDLTQLTFEGRMDTSPAWSPDGSKIAFASSRDGNPEIYVMDADGKNTVRLTTSETVQDGNPAWSPDGTRIVFESERNFSLEIYVMNADGTNQVRLTDNAAPDYSPAWSPDGRRIAFTSNREGTTGIWVMNADGSAQTRLTVSSFGDFQPTWSPDGKRIAFSARPSASTWAIFAVNADGSGRARITADFELAIEPAWSPDGRKIAFTAKTQCGWYYYYCDAGIVIVGVDGGQDTFAISGVTSEPAWKP
jgi:Tol biopolymer transport system component